MTVVAGPEPGDMRQPIRSRLPSPRAARGDQRGDPPPAASTPADVRAARIAEVVGLLAAGVKERPRS